MCVSVCACMSLLCTSIHNIYMYMLVGLHTQIHVKGFFSSLYFSVNVRLSNQ